MTNVTERTETMRNLYLHLESVHSILGEIVLELLDEGHKPAELVEARRHLVMSLDILRNTTVPEETER